MWGIGPSFPIKGDWHHDGEGGLAGGAWEEGGGEDPLGAYRSLCRTYSLGDEPLLSLTLRVYGDLVWLRAEVLRDLSGLSRADSFEQATFLVPTFRFSEELGFFLTTFGLGGSGDGYPGGYWPTAQVGKGPGELPKEAFAPLVLFSCEGALAISPASYFLTSPMVRVPGGAARGLSGAVDHLPAGALLDTVFAFGEDLPGALMRLGDVLLAQGGKVRPQPDDHPLLSTLGYWNAYGGYYTELFRPMDARALEGLAGYFRREGIPVRYFGLDLWYPYQEIGRAIRYVPDRKKYPEGLAGIAERTGLPYVLHLSALAEGNEYGADGGDGGVYKEIARELKVQRGIAAWHDWLRTQQHLTPRLRADPEAAERWFSGMAEAFSEAGLPVLLCMQTMGMALASTSHKNVIAARTYTDYLFGQKGQLENLAAQGLEDLLKEARPRQVFIHNNVLVGMVSYALGLAPFHDLFITNTYHPEGFGDELAEQEAILRALSAGPVGIGDKPGEVDKEIVRRLAFPDGGLAQPDRPLFPLQESLDEDVLVAWTETRFTDDLRWIYLVAFNVGDKEEAYRVDTHRIYGNKHFIFDYFGGQLVKEVAGILPPARARYYILVPEISGISFLGLKDKFVAMPTTALTDFQINKHEIRATLSLPRGGVYPLAVCSWINQLEVKPDDGAEVLKVEHRNDLHVAWVKATQEKFSIRFGSKARRKR
ncbi:MAG: hypothetical protein XD60_1692 [Acetothermia bacterium 64_32]|nr:MAG: hypothetical protein XD60_1692 [Acetothermia bacterium 64_32]